MQRPNTQKLQVERNELFIDFFSKRSKMFTLVCVSHCGFSIGPRLYRHIQPAVVDSRKDTAVIATC